VLLGGIGRLYFECHPQHGRVVWSQNGILQSVLDRLTLPVFQGVIHELKGMAAISPTPIEQPQQAEIEYLYDRNRVLLRFRFMVGAHGEEATVQVLRGAALKFHQQQQLNKLEKDAVSIAQQLQNKLNEIRARAYSDPALIEPKFEGLSQLSGLLHNIEQQLDAMGVEQTE
jgi:type II secretory ATPase GspE/PulE/Tfp pilus assembly ATPase PilB-like protein